MPCYYFDYHVGEAITLDDEGVDLASSDAARQLAFEALGQLLIDRSPQSPSGRIAVEVRDQSAVIVRVSAAIVVDQV